MPNRFTRILSRLRTVFTVHEYESTFTTGARSATDSDRDRYSYDRTEILDQSLEAWRVNPIARRIVGLTSQYVVGGGLAISCKNNSAANFLYKFWEHRLNRMPIRSYEWCDELTRTGNLFILVSTDSAGMSYLRAIPATSIDTIQARPNDIEQPLSFTPKATVDDPDPQPIPAYDPQNDTATQPVILHYTINRPVGAQWGESDLAPLLRWLARYANWLEDRARLNRFRNSFMYVLKGRFISEAERIARQQSINANPPQPGSILVTDESEEWTVINPTLESQEAKEDGLALKKMICAGAGIPLHFLAEPESSTRTTAESAGGPTFRHFEQRQEYFLWVIKDICQVVINRRSMVDRRISAKTDFDIIGGDISARDNVALGLASSNIVSVFKQLRDRKLIDDAELLRLVYKFAGESVDVEEMLTKAAAEKPPVLVGELTPSPAAIDKPGGGVKHPEGKTDENGDLKEPPQANLSAQPPTENHFTFNMADMIQAAFSTPDQQQPAPVINVNVPEQPAPQVTVNIPEQPAPQVTVNIPQQQAPNVTIKPPVNNVTIQPPVNNIAVEQPTVKIDIPPAQKAKVNRGEDGRISSIEVIK
jgi:hypothetical protein